MEIAGLGAPRVPAAPAGGDDTASRLNSLKQQLAQLKQEKQQAAERKDDDAKRQLEKQIKRIEQEIARLQQQREPAQADQASQPDEAARHGSEPGLGEYVDELA